MFLRRSPIQLSNKLRNKSAPFHSFLTHSILPGHVSPGIRPTSDVVLSRVSSNQLRSLDEDRGAYPASRPYGPTAPSMGVPRYDQARRRHLLGVRSVSSLSSTELLIAASANLFRNYLRRDTARSRFAPCPSRLPSRMFVSSLRQRPKFAYQACTAIPGCPPTRQWSTGWTLTPRNHPLRLPFSYVCFSLMFSYLPHPENIFGRNRTSVSADHPRPLLTSRPTIHKNMGSSHL